MGKPKQVWKFPKITIEFFCKKCGHKTKATYNLVKIKEVYRVKQRKKEDDGLETIKKLRVLEKKEVKQ